MRQTWHLAGILNEGGFLAHCSDEGAWMSQKSLTSNPPAAAVVRDIRGAQRRLLVAARLSAHALWAKPSHFAEGGLSFLVATSPERKEHTWPLLGLPSMSGS